MQPSGLFQKVFGRFAKAISSSVRSIFMNGYAPIFTPFGDDAYTSAIVRSTLDAVARNAAKLKPKHIRRTNGKIQNAGSKIEWLLSVRPNPKMNAYAFLYKIVTQLFSRSNAFFLIYRSEITGKVEGFYPIDYSRVEAVEYGTDVYLKFNLRNGKILTIPYVDVVHLRRFFNASEMFGEGNEVALLPTLELIQATNQGIINAIKTSAFVRGILKFTTNLNPADRRQQTEDFVRDYMGVGNNGGVAATDVKADFTPLNGEPKIIDAKQMALIKQAIHEYFGTNEKIVLSNYSEDEWNSFYESVIEPIALQLSLELTAKVFTDAEQAHGNEIVYEANRLQYASVKSKLELLQMVDRGAMTPNEWREVMNMAPVEGGDELIRRLDTATVNTKPIKETPKNEPAKGSGSEDDEDGGDES
ncbi:MAG: phage portal protein [Candidatus Cohnella colombiensis]|uniref:Phage portal protein n=1 Tax=Candidatus Cohnella colombiensis TaxID=3121368 RepID=A0AA95EXV4_9BACL|nr:MAG: phage portal protein [Cohnella sp.]